MRNTEEILYMLFAPDGSPQLACCGSDLAECIGVINFMASTAHGQTQKALMAKGFTIKKVKVTIEEITPNPAENDGTT